MSAETVLGLIPARGGSKGVPRKNVKELAGDPLIAHTIRAARDSTLDAVVVSTDDEDIAQVAIKFGAEVPFRRPDRLATDDAAMEPVVEHTIEFAKTEWKRECDPETVVLLQPTSPLRTGDDIDAALDRYLDADADSLVSTYEDHSYRWERTPDGAIRKNYAGDRKRRQDKTPEYVENGAIYVADCEQFLRTGDLQAGKTALYAMDQRSSVDIDTEFDFWLAEQALQQRRI